MLRIAADGGFKRIGPLARTGHNDFALGKVGEIAARYPEKPRKLRRGNLGRQHALRVACHGRKPDITDEKRELEGSAITAMLQPFTEMSVTGLLRSQRLAL